jgi:2-polyprenyl-6-methoxyphenol hydroxylase-like FAD-dependent oxidoreductase
LRKDTGTGFFDMKAAEQNQQRSTEEIVVVGGGIVGLIASIALAQKGFSVTLAERKSDIADDGGVGMGLQSNAMGALATLGLADQCIANGVAADHMEISAPDGTPLGRPPIPRNGGPDCPGMTCVSRAKFHAILHQAALAANVAILTNAEVVGCKQSDQQVAVELADGRSLSAHLVVGADGIYSAMRGLIFGDRAAPLATGEAVWRGHVKGAAEFRSVGLIFGGKLGTVGFTPMPNDEGYLYIVDREANGPSRNEVDLAKRFAELLADYGGFPKLLLPHLTSTVNWRPLETVALPSPWYQHRVLLIGDAAHAGPPTLAQGAAMGIEDAVVLAQCLAAHADLATALEAFMARRYDRVRAIVDASVTISRAQMEVDGRPAVARAQEAARIVLAQPW